MHPCMRPLLCVMTVTFLSASTGMSVAADGNGAEAAVRALVRANAEKDIDTMSKLIAHDEDIISYSIGGRKFVGWPALEQEMLQEFSEAATLELPIQELNVWTRGDLAWYTMELDYIRTVIQGDKTRRAVLPLRETGVLERRNGQWQLLSWHESFRNVGGAIGLKNENPTYLSPTLTTTAHTTASPDLSGEWEILEVEDDKRYKATLDKAGNGPYTQHGGRFVTTKFSDRLWQGTWQQPGNDREGGFEILLSEDGTQAEGIWWYSRVGTHTNIPPREHGGTYQWKRLTPVPHAP